MTNIVTINTDASFHPFYKKGAYAFWIVHQGTRIKQGGPLKSCKDSHEAEVMAIANALHALLVSDFEGVKYVILNTDCQFAIWAIRDKNKKFYRGSDFAIKKCQSLMDKVKDKYKPGPSKMRKTPFFSFRYVKAHSEGETAREWVNNWLDETAKRYMREQLPK